MLVPRRFPAVLACSHSIILTFFLFLLLYKSCRSYASWEKNGSGTHVRASGLLRRAES